MHKFLILLIAAVALSLPAAAQVYRVEHLPEFAPARGTAWNNAQGTPDFTQEIEVPNGAEVTLLDILPRYTMLVVYGGDTIIMTPRDLVWGTERNANDAIDRITDKPRLSGLGHFPLHSAIGRFLYSYGVVWWIVAVLLSVTLLQPLRFIPGNVRIFLLAIGLVSVLLIETVWMLLLGYDVVWLFDFEDLGVWRMLCHVAGAFILLYGQGILIRFTQVLICFRAGAEPPSMKIRSMVLLRLLLLFITIGLVKMVFVSEGMQIAGTLVIVAVVLWRGILRMVRYYGRLGRKWGAIALLLSGTLLVSAVVLMPLIVELWLVTLMIFACFVLFCFCGCCLYWESIQSVPIIVITKAITSPIES